MRYLGLAYYDPARFAALPAAELQALVSQCPPKDAAMQATGRLLVSASLAGPEQVVSLRPRGGRPKVTDGPFAETKELVGGLFVIEAETKEEAVRLASMHPAAALGEAVGWGIELHPIGMWLEPAQPGAGGG
jgi:hypothetical protein